MLYFFLHCDLGKEVADVVLKAGIRGSDQSKADLINLLPYYLWLDVLPKLERLTPYDGQLWTITWAREATNSQRDQEELPRMRRLVLKEGRGSKFYIC